jgi:hypothetical protein
LAQLASVYNALNTYQALTREGLVTKNVIDTVFTANRLWQYARQKGIYDDQKGAAALTWPLNFGKSPNTTTFDGDDALPIASMTDNVRRASLNWKRYTDAVAVPVTDVADNDGSPEAIANLLDVQLDVTKASLIDKISFDWLSNTPALNPKGLDGLFTGIDDGTISPNYAGFSRAQLGYKWKGNVNYSIPSGTTANFLANMHTADLQASVDGQRPDTYATNAAGFGNLIQSLWPRDLYQQPELARTAGGNDLIFNGNPLLLDNHIPSGVPTPGTPPSGTNSGGYIVGINSSFLKIIVNPNFNFALLDWALGQNQLVLFTRILWFANVVVLKPSAHWLIWCQGI